MNYKKNTVYLIALVLTGALLTAAGSGGVIADKPEQYSYERTKDGKGIIITGLSAQGYQGSVTDLVIPARIDGLPVVEIAKQAFDRNKKEGGNFLNKEQSRLLVNIKSVVMPAGLKVIGPGAFNETSISRLVIPDGVTVLEDYILTDAITSLTMPPSLAKTGYTPFMYNMAELTLPRNMNPEFVRSFPDLLEFWESKGMAAGTYTYGSGGWTFTAAR